MLQLTVVDTEGPDLDIIRTLFREYETELDENLCFQSFEEELAHPLKKYGQPGGTILLAYREDLPVGCIALKPMKEQGICEMKRLYVRPAERKYGIGRLLVNELLVMAVKKGYTVMRLDTLLKLQPAIAMYERAGFKEIPPYYHSPLPGVIYMEKQLV